MNVTSTANLPATGATSWPRLAYGGLLVFAGYYAGAKVGLALTFSPSPVSILWPPNAILMAALLLAPVRAWPMLVFAALPAHVLAEFQEGVPTLMTLSWFVSNTAEALIGAVGVRRLLDAPLRFERVREVAAFVACAVFFAPFATAFLDAAFVLLNDWGLGGYAHLWSARFFSNALATLIVVPLIVTFAAVGVTALAAAPPLRVLEAVLLACGVLVVGILAFGFEPSSAIAPVASLYLPLPFLLWAALRFGAAGAAATFAVVALVAVWGAGHGRGPFIGGAPDDNAIEVQLFLTFVGITLLVFAALMQERRRTERTLRSSEERFATAFHASPDAMAISRKSDGRFIEVNQRWLEMFGHARGDVIGRTLREMNLFAASGAREKLAPLDTEQGDVHEIELTLRSAGGGVIDALVTTRAMEMEGERRFVTIIRDETARRGFEERLRLALAVMPVAIAIIDVRGIIAFANAHAEKVFGYEPGELAGRSIDVLVATGGDGGYRAARDGVFAMPQAQSDCIEEERRARRKDGSELLVEVSLNPMQPRNGMLLLAVIADVTEHYELRRSRDELAHMTRISVMGELAASLAHELNQPLAAILANAQAAQRFMARDAMDLDEVRTILEDIVKDDSRASEVIRRMRTLAAKGEHEIAPVDLSALIHDVSVLLHTDTIVRGVRLSSDIEPGLVVSGDRVQLQQVMLNLLLNAFDAVKDCPMRARSVAVQAVRTHEGTVRVAVIDSGVGLSGDKLDKIFTPFFTSKRDGLGLGLAISRSIVEAHGGRLRAANNPVKGATFSFVLPAARA